MNAAAENPLIVGDARADSDGDGHSAAALANGNFFASELAGALDQVRTGLGGVGLGSLARLGLLCDPTITGVTRFLTDGTPGASGVMILEYTAQAAMDRLRLAATSTSCWPVSLSEGIEHLASHAPLGVEQLATRDRRARHRSRRRARCLGAGNRAEGRGPGHARRPGHARALPRRPPVRTGRSPPRAGPDSRSLARVRRPFRPIGCRLVRPGGSGRRPSSGGPRGLTEASRRPARESAWERKDRSGSNESRSARRDRRGLRRPGRRARTARSAARFGSGSRRAASVTATGTR